MKIYNSNLIENLNVLESVSEKNFPQKISFAIIKNARIYRKEYEIYEETLNKIIDSYGAFAVESGERDGNGLPILNSEEKTFEMYEDVNGLLSTEIEIFPYLISEDYFDYEDEKYDLLTPSELSKLMLVLTEDRGIK